MRVFKTGEYHGRPLHEHRVGPVDFCVTTRERGTTVPLHAHEDASFIVLLNGEHYWIDKGGKIKWSVPGVWYFRPPMHPHTHESCATDIRSLGVHFPASLAPDLQSFDSSIVLDHPSGRAIAEEIAGELKRKGAATDHALLACFYRLITSYVRNARHVEDQNVRQWLAKARKWLDDRSLDPVTLKACAEAVGSHPSHLARAFRAAYGQTVGDYIRDRRLEWAFEQLTKTDSKVSEIAVAAGFADHAHFSRVFKQRYGKSPSDLRAAR